MISKFLTSIRRLRVPDSALDYQLFQNKDLPLDENKKSYQYYIELLKYGKDNYWNRDKMIDQIVNLVTRIFFYAFPNCQALFAFDNSANNTYYLENVFLIKKMNLAMGEKQFWMRDEFNDAIQ